MFWIEFTILLLVIFLGARLKGISLGLLAVLALAIFTFLFHIQPQNPPYKILIVMAAVVTAVGTVEAAGGLTYLVHLAAQLIKKYPHQITFISPLVSYFVVFLSGTNHIMYAILPVIADVSKGIGVRPERPLSISVIAALHANLASPISVPMVLLMGCLSGYGFDMVDVVKVLLFSTLVGVLVGAIVANKLGKPLHKDPSLLLQSTKQQNKSTQHWNDITEKATFSTSVKRALGLFMLGGLVIVLLGSFKNLRPSWEVNGTKELLAIEPMLAMIMLTTASCIILLCGVKPAKIVKGKAFISGIQALITILGIAWLSDTFIVNNSDYLLKTIQKNLTAPWQFSIILLLMSAIMASPSATIQTVVPLGIAIGISPMALLYAIPAVNGVFIIPNFPTMIAAIQLDSTGTTRIGKFVFNHSFMLPGLITTGVAILVAFSLSSFFFDML